MKATLTFNLPEEQEEHYQALYGHRYKLAIDELDRVLRAKYKYEDQRDISIEEVRKMLRDCLEMYDVKLD